MKKYKCQHCRKKFSRKPNVKRHIKTVHGRNNPGFKDEPASKDRLNFHLEENDIDTNPELNVSEEQDLDDPLRKIYLCDFCGKAFSRKGSVCNHKLKMHDDMKKFPCAHCPKRFFKKSRAHSHMKSVHNDRYPELWAREMH